MNTKRKQIISQIFKQRNNSFWIIALDNDQYLICSRAKIDLLTEAELELFRDKNEGVFSMPYSWMLDTEVYFKKTKAYQSLLYKWMNAPEKPFFIEFEDADKLTEK